MLGQTGAEALKPRPASWEKTFYFPKLSLVSHKRHEETTTVIPICPMWKLRPGKVKNMPSPANCKVRMEARAKGRGLDWTGHPWRHYGQNRRAGTRWGPPRPTLCSSDSPQSKYCPSGHAWWSLDTLGPTVPPPEAQEEGS